MDATSTIKIKPMTFTREVTAMITLGFFCGIYYIVLILFPLLTYLTIRGSIVGATLLVLLLTITFIPLKHKYWEPFMRCSFWDIWVEYCCFTFDCSNLTGKIKEDERFIFFDMPHGIMPIGFALSAITVDQFSPNKWVCATTADIVFRIPFIRHFMAWSGSRPATRKNFAQIFKDGYHAAVLPGGIAEMYLVSRTEEAIYLKKRRNTIKLAIEEGAHIVPIFFFGNSNLFHVVGSGNSWLAKLSRKLRASIVLFYGRFFLPIPFRHPIHMVSGDIVYVKQKLNPSEEEIDEVLNAVITSVQTVYEKKKPAWETRPLVVY